MGCISNITGAITYDCLGGAVGIADLLLINYSDIQSISIANGIATITLTTSGKVIRVASIRKGANATEAQRINENAPNALEQSVNFTVYKKTSAENVFINTILNSRLVAVAKWLKQVFTVSMAVITVWRYPDWKNQQMITAAIPPLR